MEHSFTGVIKKILIENHGDIGDAVFNRSEIINYLNVKTRSANRGSKARGSFANLYAIFVLVEDYISNGFTRRSGYSEYEGATFTALFTRQRELPFGAKLQNHALNHRMNQEFKKIFPTCEYIPIIREPMARRYWINENLIKLKIDQKEVNLADSVIQIIDAYIEAKKGAFEKFIKTCEELKNISEKAPDQIEEFIFGLLAPNIDARIFEISSYAILKYHYSDRSIFWGFDLDNIEEENLKLYKTGRTNANDGGIDFVMKPLGRFFQVTETTDVKKYFLDIDKIEKYPITFVIKSDESEENLLGVLRTKAQEQYSISAVVKKYMGCIDEIINLPKLKEIFKQAASNGHLKNILNETILQSKVEFNYPEE